MRVLTLLARSSRQQVTGNSTAGRRGRVSDSSAHRRDLRRQRTTVAYRVVEGPPNSAASRRTIALDRRIVTILRAHRRRQQEHEAAGAICRSCVTLVR